MLARREHARAELEARLLRGGAEAADVASVLDALERDGYLSDARFAQGLVTQRAGRYGKRAIAHALRERGVDRTIAREALDGLAGRDELAEAIALLARRFSGPPRDDRERVRRIRFLIARGYDASVARRAEADAERDTPERDTPGRE